MDGIVLKHGDLFLFADDAGDLPGGSRGGAGGSLPGGVGGGLPDPALGGPGDRTEQGYGLYYRDGPTTRPLLLWDWRDTGLRPKRAG